MLALTHSEIESAIRCCVVEDRKWETLADFPKIKLWTRIFEIGCGPITAQKSMFSFKPIVFPLLKNILYQLRIFQTPKQIPIQRFHWRWSGFWKSRSIIYKFFFQMQTSDLRKRFDCSPLLFLSYRFLKSVFLGIYFENYFKNLFFFE